MVLLTTTQVMERLRVSRRTVYRLIERGWLSPMKIVGTGNILRFEETDVAQFEVDRIQRGDRAS